MIAGLASIQARVNQLQTIVGGSPVTDGMRAVAAQALAEQSAASLPSSSLRDSANGLTSSMSFEDLLKKLNQTNMTTNDGSDAPSRSATADKVISIAKQYLGVPYQWGGTDPDKGLDCSGLTQLVYKQVGIDLPRVSRDQANVGTKVDSLDDAKPGDLVFFHEPVSHVGIYLGDGKMLDAPHTGTVVKIQKVWATPTHIRRVLPSDASSDSSAGSLASTATRALSGTTARTSTSLEGPYADLFTSTGRRYGVDPALLSAVAKNESGYRSTAVSHAGARGLMQIMPATARGLGIDPMVPEQAVDGAARLLSGYLKDYDGDVKLALAAYNAGPGAVKRYDGVPPYRETQNYVDRVTSTWKDLR